PCRVGHDRWPVEVGWRHLGDGRLRAVVHHGRAALTGAGLGVVDPHAAAAAHHRVGEDAFGAQRADGRVANRVPGQPRHVPALETEVGEADRDVGLAASERRMEHRRLQEPFMPRRTQPQHDFPERHYLLHDCPRAARTLAMTRRLLSTITSKFPEAMAFESNSDVPSSTAAAPAAIHSPALSTVTPPVGISFTWGMGPCRSFRYPGPSAVAGNTLMIGAPASHASSTSVGEKQPGAATTSRAAAASMTSRRNTGLTMKEAPASATRATVSASVTVPAPSRKPAGRRGASARM